MKKAYQCPKCGGKNPELDEIRTTGSGFTRFFNIQNRRFTAIICSSCGYTEFYRGRKTSVASNILDMMIN